MSKYELDMYPEGQLPIEVDKVQPGVTKCLACVSEYIQHKNKFPNEERLPVNDAITWAPSWQNFSIMGQSMFGCVALPSCMQHLDVKDKTPQQRAMEGGLLLGGPGN
jgi:hypothetical protein